METSTLTSKSVNFKTASFSVYVVVDGPSVVSQHIEKVTDPSILDGECFYISHTDGYYFTNQTYKPKSNESRMGIKKTGLGVNPIESANLYYFESDGNGKYYIYTYIDETRKYVRNNNNNSLLLDDSAVTAFTVTEEEDGIFTIRNGSWFWNMQGGKNGKGFCSYNTVGDVNNYLNIWTNGDSGDDPYGLDGKTYGLMRYDGIVAGKTVQAEQITPSALKALAMTAMANEDEHLDKIYVPRDSDDTMWTFEWVHNRNYYVSTEVDGVTKYLKVDANGVTLSDTPFELTVAAGSGANESKITLSHSGNYISYSGNIADGFISTDVNHNSWLSFVEESSAEPFYKTTYVAKKVSVSDTVNVPNGAKVIVYTRVWDNQAKKYNIYAIDHDGSLVKCADSGNIIQWRGSAINTLLWDFTEYYYEGTTTPNYYYELKNEFSEKYIAPQKNGQILADEPIGINLSGRRYNEYYTPIVAWDDANYAYAGIRVNDNNALTSCSITKTDDFYFAIMEDHDSTDELETVDTLEHTQYGITMKMQNYDTVYKPPTGSTTSLEQHTVLGDSTGGATNYTNPGLLSTNLVNGYPVATVTGRSLSELYNQSTEVNHLFLDSVYKSSGYYEFDSTKNFASLQSNGDFKVYRNLGSTDETVRPSLQHGEFFPYNDITAGNFTLQNKENLYTATLQELPESDPRKYEKLYNVGVPDMYFGMEINASFVQTPSGLDNWGHDIIFDFTGDDDFWLYVDGELVIDLGGIHSALAANVNFSTGEVVVNGRHTTLYNEFKSNYQTRHPSAQPAEVNAYLDDIFELENGHRIFKDYTSHDMKIFYMERGGGASNLRMKFNLSSIKPGQVLLNKQISGINSDDYRLTEYGYQVYYQTEEDGPYFLLDNDDEYYNYNVTYENSPIPVKYKEHYTPPGDTTTYDSVFFLTPQQTVAITV